MRLSVPAARGREVKPVPRRRVRPVRGDCALGETKRYGEIVAHDCGPPWAAARTAIDERCIKNNAYFSLKSRRGGFKTRPLNFWKFNLGIGLLSRRLAPEGYNF